MEGFRRWLPADVTGRELLDVEGVPLGSAFVAPAALGRFYGHAHGAPLTIAGTKNPGARLCAFETREGARAAVLRELRRTR